MATIDPNKAHIGRVYDYMLGGSHNFEVDRQVARQLIARVPSYPKWAKLNRWFIQLAATWWKEAGYTAVLDLASGLPTQGHLHTQMPGARILYTDNDPITIAYSRDILDGVENVGYVQTDLREPDRLIAAATSFFGSTQRVAIGCIGIIYFLTDAELQMLAQALHSWSGPGSSLVVSFPQIMITPSNERFIEDLQQQMDKLGVVVYYRTPEETIALLSPWRVQAVRGLEEWLGVAQSITEEDRMGNIFSMFGMLLGHAEERRIG